MLTMPDNRQESRGLQVNSALGRPRLDLPLVARTPAEFWWASQIPAWEACYQAGECSEEDHGEEDNSAC